MSDGSPPGVDPGDDPTEGDAPVDLDAIVAAMPEPMVGDVRIGEVVEVVPGVRRLTAPNPGMMTGPGTNCYLVGTGEVTVVDPGPDDADHVAAIVAAGGGRIASIALTHTHVDHWPATAELAAATGAEVSAFAARDGLEPDRLLADGDVVGAGDAALVAVHTPGHASNHLCFWDAARRMLLTGDHVMAGSTVVIAPPDGDMAAYISSLEKVRALGAAVIGPAHGPLITEPDAYLGYYIEHRRARDVAVAAALRGVGAEGATTEALVAAVYTDVPEHLHPVARFSVWAHLRGMVADGRATAVDPDDPDTSWTAA